jgi:16S rRNA G966 N2-methylase RsmD
MAIPTKKHIKAIINYKTKKQKHIKLNINANQQLNKHQLTDFLKWPYYKQFITNEEKTRLITEFKQLDFKYDSSPYKPILFNRRTPIIPETFKGKYVKFIDNNYLKYDVLPLIYSETELLKCQFRQNPPAITYFEKMKHQLAAEFLKQNKQSHTIAEYREFLFSKVKQCNNFRPTLALQAYNFLNINAPNGAKIVDSNSKQAILDFSAGWGDRLFAACIGDKKYIGLDPNTNNTHIYDSIIKNHGKPDMQKVIATGAEYISIHDLKIHMTALGIKQFDLIFTSPPYFDYEIYADTMQSISNYSASSAMEFDKWITYFLLNVIMRYVPVLRDNGYIGIYIQDADNNNYLEPIGLFALAFAEQLGLTVCGIISSTRYPFIVLQKVGTHNVLPYKNPDNKKQFNKAGIISLFRKQYPVIYQLCERLLRLNKYNMLTPVLTSNAPAIYHHKNIIKRAFEKVFMQLDVNIDTIYIDDAFLEAQIPLTQPIQEFKRILDHFKIKLLPVSNLIRAQIDKKTAQCVYLAIQQPLQVKSKMPTIAFEPILLNTVDEWLLLNKKKPGDIIISDLFDSLLLKA